MSASPGPPEPAQQAAAALSELVETADHLRAAISSMFGVDRSAGIAMGILAAAVHVGPHELSERLGLSSSAVTALLDRLQGADLVRRDRHPTDRRKQVVTLTEHGHVAITRLSRLSGDVFGEFAADELADLVGLLDRITSGLERQRAALVSESR